MHRSSSAPRRRTGVAVAALACAALLSPAITPSRAAPELTSAEAEWVPLLVPSRFRHAAVLDPGRDRMLVFGGESGAGVSNRVQALPLSGATDWSPIVVSGSAPLARRSAGVVYDPVRDRLLVFGGSDGATTYNDLWALSLAGTPHWSFLGSGGALVPPREEHVTVYDAAHDRLVVFGGIDAEQHVLSDCWSYSLSGVGAGTWNLLGAAAAGPLARQSACGVYDPVRDRLLVFGGADSSGTLLGDTWALPMGAGGTWAKVPLASGEPEGRERAAAAYDAGHDQMVVYGGRGQGGLLDVVLTLSFPGTAAWNTLMPSTPRPAAREWAAAIVDPLRDRLVVYGGGTPGPSSDVVAFGLGATHPWTTLTPTSAPHPFRAAALVRDPVRNRMLLFGGLDASNVASNSVWSLDLSGPAAWTLLTPTGAPPGARFYASAVYDAARDRVLVFGGVGFVPSFFVYNDVWSLQLAGTPTWQLLSPSGTPPSPRYLHSAIVDPVRDRMVVFGGSNGTIENNELWTLDLGGSTAWTSWTISDPSPAPRGTYGAIYDPVRDRMIICDGTDFATTFADVWALPLAGPFHWQALAPNGPAPPARYLAGWGYDAARDRLLVFGGRDLGSNRWSDAWALQFGATDQWIDLEPAGPSPVGRYDHCAAFDPDHDRFVITGGRLATSLTLTEDAISIDWQAVLTSAPPASPREIALAPPFPNPARDAVTIRFVTTALGRVRVAIHDVSGRHVCTLEDDVREPGAGALRWDGRDDRGARVPPGVYLVQMRSQGRLLSRRIVRTE
jgi:hypothetical protein